jgi:uncharacterized OB-fold protein
MIALRTNPIPDKRIEKPLHIQPQPIKKKKLVRLQKKALAQAAGAYGAIKNKCKVCGHGRVVKNGYCKDCYSDYGTKLAGVSVTVSVPRTKIETE